MSTCGDDEKKKSIQKGESFKTLQVLELTFRYLSRLIKAFNSGQLREFPCIA